MSRLKKEKTIRAYKIAEASDNLLHLHSIKRKIALYQFGFKKEHVSKHLFGSMSNNVELIARQLLLSKLNSLDFNIHLLKSVAFQNTLTYPLPTEWQKILTVDKINVNRIAATLYFRWFIFKRLCINSWQVFKLLIRMYKVSYPQDSDPPKNHVIFCDISKNCLAWDTSENCYTITNWYMKWEGSVANLEEIKHTIPGVKEIGIGQIKICYGHPFARIDSERKKQFFTWAMGSIGVAAVSFFSGRWVNPLLLHEAAMAKIIDLTKTEVLAKEYLFSISSFSVRPLWTYIAEKKGSVITNYSYASSFQGLKTKNGYVNQEYYFEITNWPRLLYWTEHYVSHLKLLVDRSIEVLKVPAIYYTDQPFEFPEIAEQCVAVFDVSPLEEYENDIRLPETFYRNFENGKKFLFDIYKTLEPHNVKLLWKRKRVFGKLHSSDFMLMCDEFEKLRNVICIPPDVSAFKVVKRSHLCISMPFTSTAFIAREDNIPSGFYDPSGTVDKDDRGAQGVKILSGLDELKNWVSANIHSSKI